ncbi:methyltransferase domain-containing protein [Amycolatopsis sp. NPDC051371]|uniref:methyltransferase domain-containing protein n=1 Tax=Amycolatopsis sp. NPDC051371 TaxID=3155800 RepID=UPI0034379048
MTTEPLLARLDRADALPGAQELREATYELLRCEPGDRVLDVGCGGGRAVAELCGRGVRAVGADRDPGMLAAARARSADVPPPARPERGAPPEVRSPGARTRGLPPPAGTSASLSPAERSPIGEPSEAGFVEADVLRLPFAGGAFHGYRADKVLHELADPAAAVAEARRVLAPGGRVVLCGQDWDTLVLDSDRPALTRAIVHARADAIAGPRAARQYRTLLVDAGFTGVAVEVTTMADTDGGLRPLLDGLAAAARDAGVATRVQVDAWLREQAARAAAGRFFLAIPIFVASATAPDGPQ